jgi:hypothetical protein
MVPQAGRIFGFDSWLMISYTSDVATGLGHIPGMTSIALIGELPPSMLIVIGLLGS